MKRGISILLLFCFSFYHFGYYLFYFSYRYKIENDWTTSTYSSEREFDEEQLIKIPVHIPYLEDQEDFYTTNTSFVKNGASYRVVKQRYLQDTLQVVYVPDIALNRLDQTVKGWVASLTEGVDQEASNGKIIPKNFIKDYLQPFSFVLFTAQMTVAQPDGGFVSHHYFNIHLELPDRPPEVFVA